MYLSCDIRPDIAFVVGQLNKQNPYPGVEHLKAAKRVFQYFKGMIYLELTFKAYLKSEQEEKTKAKVLVSQLIFNPIGYTNSNYADNPKDRTLVIGYCFFIHKALVSWYTKKQRTVSNFIPKAKYIVLGNVIRKSL